MDGASSDALIGFFEQDQLGRRRSRLIMLIFVIGAALVVGWYLLKGCAKSTAELPAEPAPNKVAPPAAAKPPLPQPAPNAAAERAAPAAFTPAERRDCVASLLGTDALSSDARLEWLCEDRDLRNIMLRLHAALIQTAKGRPTPAIMEWGNLDWFQLPTTAAARTRCCTGEVKLELPKQQGSSCEPLENSVMELATAPLASSEVEARAKHFYENVLCLYAKGVPRPYPFKKPPNGFNRKTFEALAARIVSLDKARLSQ
jgi:hypothetical protein